LFLEEGFMNGRTPGFLRNESGATALEYGILAALVGISIVTAAALIGGNMTEIWGGIRDFTASGS